MYKTRIIWINLDINLILNLILTSSFLYSGVFLSALPSFVYKEFAYEYEILSLQ